MRYDSNQMECGKRVEKRPISTHRNTIAQIKHAKNYGRLTISSYSRRRVHLHTQTTDYNLRNRYFACRTGLIFSRTEENNSSYLVDDFTRLKMMSQCLNVSRTFWILNWTRNYVCCWFYNDAGFFLFVCLYTTILPDGEVFRSSQSYAFVSGIENCI